MAIYPGLPADGFQLYADEEAGILLARNGVLTQIYSIPLMLLDDVSRGFVHGCHRGFVRECEAHLIGRTTLDSNPLTLPLIESLNSMRDLDGSGMLLNENNHPIYHSDKSQSLIPYRGQRKPAIFL